MQRATLGAVQLISQRRPFVPVLQDEVPGTPPLRTVLLCSTSAEPPLLLLAVLLVLVLLLVVELLLLEPLVTVRLVVVLLPLPFTVVVTVLEIDSAATWPTPMTSSTARERASLMIE